MAYYEAVALALEQAHKDTELLREVMRKREENKPRKCYEISTPWRSFGVVCSTSREDLIEKFNKEKMEEISRTINRLQWLLTVEPNIVEYEDDENEYERI